MARAKGRFGRRPRSGGNLTALVAALYREQRAAEDRQMFDAWENGGLVDGKPVTDQRLRDYIAGRRDGMGKDDPLYDEWNNRLIQLDFRIGEEKIQLAFQQGKVGAGAVANYYRSQLGKIPKDSAFYREVAGRAAQWAKSAAGAASGRARSRMSAALADKADKATKTQLNFFALDAIVTEAAKRAGIIAGNQTVTDADASRLLELFNGGIVSPKGQVITFANYQQAALDHYKAFDVFIAIEKQRGNKITDNLKSKGKFLDQYLVRINTIDDRSKYEAARELWEEEVGEAQGNPSAIAAANGRYVKSLEQIMASADKPTGGNKSDPEFIGGLTNEINAVRDGKFTGPTVFDLQSTSTEAVTEGDAQSTALATQALQADAKALDNGTAFYGQSEFGGAFGVQYYQPGTANLPNRGLGSNMQDAILDINGTPTPVKMAGQAVKSTGLAKDGQAVTAVDAALFGGSGQVAVENLSAAQYQYLLQNGFDEVSGGVIGYVFQNGQQRTYGVFDAAGNLKFTESNPFEGGTLLVGEGGSLSIVAPSTVSPAGTVQAAVPALNLGSTDDLFVDPSVSPQDLRNAAKVELDPEKQTQLLAYADKKQKGIQRERDVESRLGDRRGDTNRSLFEMSVPGFAQDVIRTALGVATNLDDALASSVPNLKKASAPPIASPSPQIATPPAPAVIPPVGAPGAYRPPPPPKPVTANDLSDEELDYIKPKPKPKPTGGGGIPGNKLL